MSFFAEVAFRYGHSEVSNLIKLAVQGSFGVFPFWQYVQMDQVYFEPGFVKSVDVNSVWLGMANMIQQSMDGQFDDTLRNFFV